MAKPIRQRLHMAVPEKLDCFSVPAVAKHTATVVFIHVSSPINFVEAINISSATSFATFLFSDDADLMTGPR